MSRLVAILVVLSISLPALGRDVVALFDASIDDQTPDSSYIYKTVSGQDLWVHVFEPEDGVRELDTAIVLYHGGGWEGGQPDYLFPHCSYFARLGYVAISVEYRLAGVGLNTIFDCVDDARDAFYWVAANATTLGISAEQIVVGGESSGGHLAACIGYIQDPRLSGIPVPQPEAAACILLNPILDLTTISWAMSKPGLSPDDIPGAQSISPQFHVGADSPPAVILHGSSDTVVPQQQSTDFAQSLYNNSIAAQLRIWDGKAHAFFLYLPPGYSDKEAIQLSLLEIEAFLQFQQLNGYPQVHGHFSPIHLFDGTDGFRSFSELLVLDGLLYGSTYKGGANDNGVLFKLNPGTLEYTLLHEFSGADGNEVFNGLATDGSKLYGVTKFGGTNGDGVLFEIGKDGTGFSILHHFDRDAWAAHSAPILISGVLYGTTYHGGDSTWGGTLYKYPLPSDPLQIMHSFDSTVGRHPTGRLIQIGDWLYGTASDLFQHAGGHYGSLYRINMTTNTFELLHKFNDTTEGSHPYDHLYYDGSDLLIGTNMGQAFTADSMGVIYAYSISQDTLTVLHDFENRPGTGSKPNGGLITNGDSSRLYGVAHGSNDATGDLGTLFAMDPDGSDFTVYHRFTEVLSGNIPMRSLVRLGDSYYGVAVFGGLTTDISNAETGGGMVFKYTPNSSFSDDRQEYIDWLAGSDQLVNQDPDGNPDADASSLIEEFAFGGDSIDLDAGLAIEFQISSSPVLHLPKVRTSMLPYISAEKSADLETWIADPEWSPVSISHPLFGPEFSESTQTWSTPVTSETPFFRQLRVNLPD